MTMSRNLDEIVIGSGAHDSREDGMCVMELAAYLAGETHSDHPQCVSPAIAAFLRTWNDCLDDDARQMLKPLALRVLNTAADAATEERRSLLALDWLIRVHVPAWLRLVPSLSEHADALASLPDLTAPGANYPEVGVRVHAARAAAWDAAWDAAWAAIALTVTELQASAMQLVERMIAA